MRRLEIKIKKINYLPAASLLALLLITSTLCRADNLPAERNYFYVGRYALEIPTHDRNTWSSYKIIDKKLELVSRNGKRDLPIKTADSITEINKLHSSGYAAYDRTIELMGGGAIVISKSTRYNLEIYYLTKENTLYRQNVDSISIQGIDQAIARVKELNELIHYRNPAEPPPKGTFAIEAGYVSLPINKFQEQVSIGLSVSSVPGIHLTFDTQLIGKPEPSLISRYEQRSSGAASHTLGKLLSKSTPIRKAPRKVAGLNFEELLLKTDAGNRRVYDFRLEYPGTPNSSLEPYTVLELSTLDEGVGFKNDEEALAFWDTLVERIKRI